MHKTRNDIPEKVRVQVAALLQERLAEAIDFEAQTKQAHWNVRGKDFYQLHKLFDDLAEPLEEFIDTLAERAVTLGGLATGTVRNAAAASELPEFPLQPGGIEYAKELSQRFARAGNSVREAIDTADELSDRDTADIFTDISRELDKSLYFLEAHFRA